MIAFSAALVLGAVSTASAMSVTSKALHVSTVAQSYAQAAPTAVGRNFARPANSNEVFAGGQYLGSDPDPAVRLSLTREWSSKDR
jgi:hypothetical protein